MKRATAIIIAVAIVVLIVALVYAIVNSGYFNVTHDVAITDIRVSKTEFYLGDVLNITITAKNNGTRPETFNVTLYGNSSRIDTLTVTNLGPASQSNLTFSWNTAALSAANYLLKAQASTVPGETITRNNALTDGYVYGRRSPSPRAALYVFPPHTTAGVGETFSIKVNISDVADLYGWELKLGWNTTVLQMMSVTEGDFLKSGGNTYFTTKTNSTAGYIKADCTLIGVRPGESGNGTLLTVQFQVKATGTSVLNIYGAILLNSLEQSIVYTITNGDFATS